MHRDTTLSIILSLLLVAPLAVGAGGLGGLSAPTDAHDDYPYEAHLPDGTTVIHDANHTNNVIFETSEDPAEVGRWLEPVDGEVPAVNLALLSDGRLMYFSGVEARDADQTSPTDLTFMVGDFPKRAESRVMTLDVLDGEASATVAIPDPESGGHQDLFCSGTTIAPDGTVLTTGGTEWHTLDEAPPDNFLTPLKGSEQVMRFHSHDGQATWERGEDMSVDRWYPSALQLGDGRTMIASGIQTLFMFQTHNTVVELYDPVNKAYEVIDPKTQWADGVETSQLFPDRPETGQAPVDEIPDRLPNLPMYPRLFVVPGGEHKGEVFYTTAGDLWGPFGEHPAQPLWSAMQTFDAESGTFTVHDPSVFGARQLAASVPFMVSPEDGYAPRYLTFGGTLQQSFLATDTAEVADLSGESITAEATDRMNAPRWHVNGVLLPNGEIMAIGGGLYDNVIMHGAPNVAFLNGEIYDPETGEWTLTAPQERSRIYHSTSLLLPDGRVLSAGHVALPAFHEEQREGENPQIADTTFEVYEPPYLFLNSDRPEILGAQDEATYGESIQVLVDNLDQGEASLDSVVLMRPGASTHAYDADQRGVELTVESTRDAGNGVLELTVTAPPDGAVAAPGHYMLFVNEDVDGEPMPSEATFLHLS